MQSIYYDKFNLADKYIMCKVLMGYAARSGATILTMQCASEVNKQS
jgi:hypothetical protein